MASRIIIKYNHLPQLAQQLPQAVSEIVRRAAFAVEGFAKIDVPVDTGKLKNSISTEAEGTKATIAPHTDYAAYVEYGTHKMRARPYMRPAAEKVAPQFVEECKNLESKLK